MPSNNVPTPQSYEQLLGDSLSSYASKVGIDDFNVGSAVTSFFEVVALVTARSSGDLFQILRDFSVDRATGDALQRLATENNITPITASPATGYVTVIDTSFTKISTSVYAGSVAPNVGSTEISVGNASMFPASGSLYIGRGTNNVEGPIAYGPTGLTLTGNTTLNSNIITNIPSTADLLPGFIIFGSMIPSGTTILSVDSPTQIHITNLATNTVVGASLTYNAIPVQTGNFWTITLSTGTLKFHNINETVILAQGGNRPINLNTIVTAPAVGNNPSIQYSVTAAAIILDGETSVSNIPVTALLPGADGNIPIGTIQSFATLPFAGATVTNPLPFTTGADNETDNALRVRIKNALASIGLGTATAVMASVIGATASDEQATVVNDSLLQASYGAVLYIDDGTIYEAKTAGVGLESIVDSAIGGEQFFQLATGGRQAPVAKAFLISNNSAPFDIKGGDTLAVIIGGQTYQHTFSNSDFLSPGSATAYEITASINADTSIAFEGTTSGGGTFVVIRYKNEGNDSIQITTPTTDGRDAAIQLGFSSSQIQTLRLFKNNVPLSKDGSTATLFTQDQQLWSPSIVNGDTLILAVDNTAPITYTLSDADFIATGLYTSVNTTNSLESWAQVFNAKFTGVTTEVVGQQLSITSNLGTNSRAALSINASSTLVTKGMFSTVLGLTSQGVASDFTLDRNTAQFELVVPLIAGDTLAAGTTQTQGRVQSTSIPTGNVTLAQPGYMWILVDEPGVIIPTGVIGSSLISVSVPLSNTVRYTSNVANAFNNVNVGDYVIVWSTQLVAGNRIEGRVHAVTNTTLDILVTPTEAGAVIPVSGVVFANGFVVLRSALAPQKFEIPSGTLTLDQVVVALQTQTESLLFTVQQEEFLTASTITKDTTGSVLIVTADSQAATLNFPTGIIHKSVDSLIAYYDTQEYQAQMPLFIHSGVMTGTSAQPPDSYIASFVSDVALNPNDPNNLISILQPYGTIDDAQPAGESAQESYNISGTTVNICYPDVANSRNLYVSRDIRRLRSIDRFFVASPLDFGANDTAVAVVDNNPSSESFTIPLYRTAVTNTTRTNNSNDFNAYDADAGATATFPSSFGSAFDFANFKALMLAKKTLKPTPPMTALLYRSAVWGGSGEKISVGYVYPSVANSALSSTVTVNETVTILISLQSGATVATSIDGTTEWNITITPNTPSAGIDQVTYTYNGTGTAPALTLVGGEYVNIGNQTEFDPANTGVFRVSTQSGFTPTSTSFTVQRPDGVAVAQSNVATQVSGSIVFYQPSSTTAAQVNTYVNANLSKYITSTIVLDGDMSGSGVILLSTYEDSGFQYSTQQLRDGFNWIAFSTLGSSPQFTLKLPLALPSDVGYAFNNGEIIRLTPTTVDQVKRFLSILAVTGFTTAGTVDVVDRGTRLELATDTLGSSGSIQIIGGLANSYETPVLGSGNRVDNSIMNISVDSVSGQGIQSNQWFKLQASNTQTKNAGYNVNTSVTLIGGSPSANLSTVQLLNRQLNQRYFGQPRSYIRSQGDTFRIESQGSLVCLSWNGVGTNPTFEKSSLNFNDTGGGTVNIFQVASSSSAQYVILSGNANFTELSIGDYITIAGANFATANTGTFLVTGVSDDGTNIQVYNPNAVNQFSYGTYTLNNNSFVSGDTFTIGGTALVAGTNFAIGANADITAVNLSTIIGTLPGVTSFATNNIVTVTATSPSANITLAYSGAGSVTITNSPLQGPAFIAGNFSASSSVSEGDTVILGAPFNVLNQGQYRVIRRYNSSIWFENPDVVQEEVTLPFNGVSIGFDSSTSFMINATGHTQLLTWNGTGTQPFLGFAQVGDIVTFGIDFSSNNQGSFMVTNSGVAQTQIVSFAMPSGSQFTPSGPGQYFNLDNAGDVNRYYVWFNVTGGTNTDPTIGGRTGLEITILASDTSAAVANKAAAAILAVNGGLDFSASNSGGVLTVTTLGSQTTALPTNGTMPVPFSISVSQIGQRTFLEVINPSTTNQSSVTISSGMLLVHRPQMQFYEYDAIVPLDQIVITSNNFLPANVKSWNVSKVINRSTAVVTGTMTSIANVSLNGIVPSFYNEEGTAYSGYKRVSFVVAQPGTATRTLVTFDTNAQYDKINESAGVQLTSLNKLNFSTVIKNGLDSYRYNTGLIAEANRIVYGDPRDPSTYPGVGAAGADIFIREPLALRVQVALDIRLNTGVPFAQTVQQVQNAVSSLVGSNPVGQSIAISSIISVVGAIPGILAVSISSPIYSINDDLIILTPGQKAFILDPTTDISVSQIGT